MELVPYEGHDLLTVGQIADSYARQNIFQDYQQGCAPNTLRRQKADVQLFVNYLKEAKVQRDVSQLMSDPDSWQGISYGLLKGFVKWQLTQGYAVGSINVRLTTIRKYCSLAFEAGAIDEHTSRLLETVHGYSDKQARNIDKTREQTRKGDKKAVATSLNVGQAALLKKQPDTRKGKRDSLLMCLLLDHGLRCGEVESLQETSINLVEGTIIFYREKVDIVQTHRLTADTMIAAMNYFPTIAKGGPLFYGQGGKPLSDRAINDRVGALGKSIGVERLSPHDCRHYWATIASRKKTPIKALQTAGGWKSPAMPLHYAEASEIANEGVILE